MFSIRIQCNELYCTSLFSTKLSCIAVQSIAERGRTNERPGSDHVTSGPMRGLEIFSPDGANGHGDSMTEMAQWGRISENCFILVTLMRLNTW